MNLNAMIAEGQQPPQGPHSPQQLFAQTSVGRNAQISQEMLTRDLNAFEAGLQAAPNRGTSYCDCWSTPPSSGWRLNDLQGPEMYEEQGGCWGSQAYCHPGVVEAVLNSVDRNSLLLNYPNTFRYFLINSCLEGDRDSATELFSYLCQGEAENLILDAVRRDPDGVINEATNAFIGRIEREPFYSHVSLIYSEEELKDIVQSTFRRQVETQLQMTHEMNLQNQAVQQRVDAAVAAFDRMERYEAGQYAAVGLGTPPGRQTFGMAVEEEARQLRRRRNN
jgi:hypothetical protein